MKQKFLTRMDMHEARRASEIFNSQLKRGEISNSSEIARIHHVKCGCVFISVERK